MDSLDKDAEKTIFTSGSDLSSEERDAVKKGEKRGEQKAMESDPERFGMARARAKGRVKYAIGYSRIKWA